MLVLSKYAQRLMAHLDAPEREALSLAKELGCGHEGCVFATSRNTVVKLSHDGQMELFAAQKLQPLVDEHPIVPHVVGAGQFASGLVWIEREGLNDLQLSDEGEAMFTDDLGRLLGGTTMKVPKKFPSFVPQRDQQLLFQLAKGYVWLTQQGFNLEDHNTPENWGVRADGSVALRDLGHIFVRG